MANIYGSPGLSFSNGLLRGYSVVNGIETQKAQLARQDRLDQQNEEHWQAANDRADQTMQLRQQQADREQQLTDQTMKLNKMKMNELQQKQQEEKNLHYGKAVEMYALHGITPDPETQTWMKEKGLNVKAIMSPQYTQAATNVMDYMNNMSQGKPSPGIDLVHNLNVIYSDKLKNRTGGPAKFGGKIQKVAINKIVPTPDGNGVYINLDVTAKKKDGSTYDYQAPMTENGATADNAKVQPFSVQELLGDVSARIHMNRALITAAQAQVIKSGGSIPGNKYKTVAKDAGLYDATTHSWVQKPGSSTSQYPGGIKPSTFNSMYNSMKDGVKSLFMKMDPNGQFFVPAGADKEMAKALMIGNDLIANKVPVGKATYMAWAAVRGKMNDKQAMDAAIIQIKQNNPKISSSELKTQAAALAPKIKTQSEQAWLDYQNFLKKNKTGGPPSKSLLGLSPTSKTSQPSNKKLDLSTPDAVRKAMQEGQISRQEARQKLEAMGFGG